MITAACYNSSRCKPRQDCLCQHHTPCCHKPWCTLPPCIRNPTISTEARELVPWWPCGGGGGLLSLAGRCKAMTGGGGYDTGLLCTKDKLCLVQTPFSAYVCKSRMFCSRVNGERHHLAASSEATIKASLESSFLAFFE